MMSKGAEESTSLLVRFEKTRRTDGTIVLCVCTATSSFAYLASGPQQSGDLVIAVNGPPPRTPHLEVKLRDAEVAWSRDYASMRCAYETASILVPGLAAFAQVEAELYHLEQEVEASWSELAEDRPILFEATPADLRRGPVLATRVAAAFERRVRFARLHSCLLPSGRPQNLSAAALTDKLAKAAEIEERLEVLDGQLEVFEHIYELVSQRLGEFRASHQGNRVEWIIIVLLFIEVCLMILAGWHGSKL